MSSPKRVPYRDREDVVARYCTCGYQVADGDEDGDSRVKVYDDPHCPLHSDDPKHDLPETL